MKRPLTPSERRSRRSFLRAVGGAAMSLPFIRSLEHSAVSAQSGILPMNFIGVIRKRRYQAGLASQWIGQRESWCDACAIP